MEQDAKQYAGRGAEWMEQLQCLFAHIGRRFGRIDRQRHAWEYLLGLLSPVERKNGWQLAEAAEQTTPYSLQHLLDRAPWEADALRDDLVDYVVEELGDSEGVLVVDETGFLKKGRHSVGVQRQYSGTAGRIENCQVGVFLAYASRRGRALLDRELYLPKEWADDPARRSAAKVPAAVEFATKPQLAQRMIERALATQLPFAWVTGDEVYGDNYHLRVWLEQQEVSYVLAVRSNAYVWLEQFKQTTVDQLAATVPQQTWEMLSAGAGAKGPRWYEWVRIPLLSWQVPGERWLLLRRSLADGKLAHYVCHVQPGTDLATMARVAGTRWTIEECFEAAKGEVGLDQYEVRSWHGWYRHITLAMLAHAYLTVLCAQAIAGPDKKKRHSSQMRQWKQHRRTASH